MKRNLFIIGALSVLVAAAGIFTGCNNNATPKDALTETTWRCSDDEDPENNYSLFVFSSGSGVTFSIQSSTVVLVEGEKTTTTEKNVLTGTYAFDSETNVLTCTYTDYKSYKNGAEVETTDAQKEFITELYNGIKGEVSGNTLVYKVSEKLETDNDLTFTKQ